MELSGDDRPCRLYNGEFKGERGACEPLQHEKPMQHETPEKPMRRKKPSSLAGSCLLSATFTQNDMSEQQKKQKQ